MQTALGPDPGDSEAWAFGGVNLEVTILLSSCAHCVTPSELSLITILCCSLCKQS